MSYVEIKHLTKFYSKNTLVIKDMNLSFPETGLNIVVGKSGCGKTTLLNAISTMDNDYTGDIIVGGVRLHDLNSVQMSRYKNFTIGYIFQKDDLFEELTVLENLQIVLRMQNKKADIKKVLEQVGLAGFENRKIKYLSGGERQRVGIARVIIKDCKIILADEPTSALDSKNGHRIFKLLKEISKDRLVIAVTHDTKKAFQYADRIIKLSDGNVLEDDQINKPLETTYQVKEKKSNPFALLPIFKFQFSHGLFINIFVSILIALAMSLCSISHDSNLVVQEYKKYEEQGYTDINIIRTIETQIANNIDEWVISKVDGESDPYEYIKMVADVNSSLSISEINALTSKYSFNAYSFSDNSVGGLYIHYVSPSYYGTVYDPDTKSDYGWNAYGQTNVIYYMYNPSSNYELSYGRYPQIGEAEMLVTDTFAYMYMDLSDRTFSGDIADIIGREVEVFEVYHSVYDSVTKHDYVYYDTVKFTVTGVINTHQLEYSYFDSTSKKFVYFSKFETQSTNEYMNQDYNNPDVSIYTGIEINSNVYANRNHPFYPDGLDVDSIKYNSVTVSTKLASFIDDLDYRFYLYPRYYETRLKDSVYIDRNNILICKDSKYTESNQDLGGNEVILPISVAKEIFSDITTSNANTYLGRTINLTFNVNGKSIAKDVTITGYAKSGEAIYVSNELFLNVHQASLEEVNYRLRVSLKGLNLEERLALMSNLYKDGYILSPVDMMPGAYSEFIYERSIAVYDEGEEGNISPYYLFSEYYNLDNVKKTNRLLDILSNILSFSVGMALVVTIGCVYLNERKHRLHIVKMSILGVTPLKILFMQTVTYILMSALTFVLTTLSTTFFINMINKNVALNLTGMNADGQMIDFVINRIRIVLTDSVTVYSFVGAAITLGVGIICASIAIKQFKK